MRAVVGAGVEARGTDEGLAVAEPVPVDQVAAGGELDDLEAIGVGVVGDVAGGVVHGGQADVESFVTEDGEVVDVDEVIFGIVMAGMLDGGVGESAADGARAEGLVEGVGFKDEAVVFPGLEVAAGEEGVGADPQVAVFGGRAAAFDGVDEQASVGVVGEVAFIVGLDGGDVEVFPADAVGGDGEALVELDGFVAACGVGVMGVADGHVDGRFMRGPGDQASPSRLS